MTALVPIPVLDGQLLLDDGALTPDEAIAWVMDAYGQAVEGVIETGRRLLQLRAGKVHGNWLVIFDQDRPNHLPFSQPTAWRLMAVAQHPVISSYAHAHSLPASWSVLAELARLPADEVARRIESGDIHPTLERSTVQDWIRSRGRTAVGETPPLPAGVFRVIEADPPWAIPSGPKGPEANYDTMPLDAIGDLPIGDMADPAGAHLYLWATNSLLDEAFDVMRAWGFTYRTTLTWVKPRIGLGAYFRNTTEHVLFGVRGELPLLVKDQPTHFNYDAPKIHSRKPEGFYDLVERCSPGPYVRLFARTQRLGWESWGAEA